MPHLCNILMISMKFNLHKKVSDGADVSYREHALAYPQSQFTQKRGSVGADVYYREHALAYPRSQFTQIEALLGQTCNTGSMPLLTPDHSLHKERLCWSRHAIQRACPCIPPITVYTKRGSVGADVSYWEHALAYLQSQLTQREALLE